MGMRALRALPLLAVPAIAAPLVMLGAPATPKHSGYKLERAQAQLAFEPAAGRFGGDVRFLARTQRMTLLVGDRGSTIVVGGSRRARVRTTLVGARTARATGAKRLPGVVNAYVGRRALWRSGLPTFGQVTTAGVYPGVDLAYHGRNGRLEYDFRVAPGADPGQIAMRVSGGRSLRLDSQGNLVIGTGAGPVRQLKPVALQGDRRVDAGFALAGNKVRFRVGDYDHSRPLLIDPQFAYASYLGGSNDEYSGGVTIDSSGNAYIAGQTGSANFPGSGTGQGYDAFLTKVSPDGKTRLYSTYFGGSGTDDSYGVGLDSSGNAYIAGHTESSDLPGRSTGMQTSLAGGGDGYVAKFDASGALVRSTYLGGGSQYDFIFGIAVDASGNSYVTGETLSSDFPTGPGTVMQGAQGNKDGFVTELAPSLQSRAYSTYLGGGYDDYGNAIAVGPDGSAYVTGYTRSAATFPLTNAFDSQLIDPSVDPSPGPIVSAEGFVTRLAPDGATRIFSTFIGGDAEDQGSAIAVDSSGTAYVAGSSQSTYADHFSESGSAGTQEDNAGGADALIAKIQSDGQPDYVWWYGGSVNDVGTGVSFDPQGDAYFIGRTASTNLLTTPGVPQTQNANAATTDAWVMKMSSGREITYASYLGGASFDNGAAIVADSRGSAYLVGDTSSNDFPVTSAPMQLDRAGANDAWFAKLVISPVTFTSGPDGTLRSRDASFTYTTSETPATVVCRLLPVEANFAECPRSGKSYQGLVDGGYTFEAAVRDSAGTTSDPVARAFTVDTRPIADFAIAPNPALAGRTVTFDGSASSGAAIALTRFEWDTDGDGSFERDTGTTSSTTAVFPSPRTLQISLRVTDAEGKTATVTKELRVTTPPTGSQFGVTINKGARWTNTPDVTVSANFPASTTALLFSNDGGFLSPAEFPAKPTVKWKLDSSGPERLPKTIYVRFLSGPIVSETHQDDIILDETPPKVQEAVVAPAGGAAGARTAVAAKLRTWKVRVKATDKNSGVGRVQVTSNKRKPGKLLKYKRRLVVKSAARPRWIRARDRAGNFSKWRKARR